MVKSPKRRTLGEVLPPLVDGLQVNFCRNPECANFGVPPSAMAAQYRRHTQPGDYILDPGGREGVKIRCLLCNRVSTLVSNAGLALEIERLRTANGLLRPDSCPEGSCENRRFPVAQHPERYYRHGRTRSGTQRWRCRQCRSTLTLTENPRAQTAGDVNHDIVKDVVNRASLNAILRKTRISPRTLYVRLDFIHRQMIAFEAYKVRRLRETRRPHRRHFALATDAQDQWVNWESRDRRHGITISTMTTADNYSGFIFRTDTSFDPTTGDVVDHFRDLLDRGDFDVPGGLGLSRRLQLPAFLDAVGHALMVRAEQPPAAEDIRLAKALEALGVKLKPEEANASNPITGAMVSPVYTAMAHFSLVSEMLPAGAQIHLMTDTGGTVTAAAPTGFMSALRENRVDLAYVFFNKGLKTTQKQAIMSEYKKRLTDFLASCDPTWGPREIRLGFMRAFARRANRNIVPVPADWWRVPIETMYEPQKVVGISYQRKIGTAADMEERRYELLARSSLHSVDSFFNVLRQRVSYLHRPGHSRSSETFYNAFQAYRPAMIQKVVDISRVWFNWVEPRPFRIARKFDPLAAAVYDTSHQHMKAAEKKHTRSEWRQRPSTPAMRIGLAKRPIRLDTILYGNWPEKLLAPAKKRSPDRYSVG